MTTPRFRHWMRTSGPQLICGLLIGLGLVILVLALLVNPSLAKAGFRAGITLSAIGIAGLFITA